MRGGVLQHRYPIIIHAEAPQVRVQIDGGCAQVPIRFEGLKSATGYTLYQIVDGQAIAFDQSCTATTSGKPTLTRNPNAINALTTYRWIRAQQPSGCCARTDAA